MPITNEVNNARRFCKGAYRIGERTVTFLVAVILPRENRPSDRATVPSACEPALHRHTNDCAVGWENNALQASHSTSSGLSHPAQPRGNSRLTTIEHALAIEFMRNLPTGSIAIDWR